MGAAETYKDLHQKLVDRRLQLIENSETEREGLSAQVPESPGDVGDSSVLDTSADYYLKLADNDRRELAEISAALERLKRGDYGICETCESDIPVERLRHVPFARRCIDCQSLAEQRLRTTRPQGIPKL